MGPGVALLIIGAIFAFAMRKELPGIDIQTVGVILMLASVALIVHAQRGRVHEEETTRVEEQPHDPNHPTHTVIKEKTTERDHK